MTSPNLPPKAVERMAAKDFKDFIVFDSHGHVVRAARAVGKKYVDPEYRTLGKNALWRQEGRSGAYRKVKANGEVFCETSNLTLPRHAQLRPGMDWDPIGALDPNVKQPATTSTADSGARLADIDAMGIDRALLYPTWFAEGFFLVRNPNVPHALPRAYNARDGERRDPGEVSMAIPGSGRL
jgi:hypothetical protein